VNPLPDGNGATTEIGSVPDLDAAAAVEAAILHHPEMPFVPELPRKDRREGMLERVLCDSGAGLPSPERASGLHAFLARMKKPAAPRRVKVGLAGPILLGRRGRPFDRNLAPRIAKALAGSESVPLVQFDEPGTTDDATAKELGRLADAMTVARACGARVAIHDCGAVRGATLLALAPDAISVDATKADVPLLADGAALGRYLVRGGSVIWGVVPTGVEAPPEPDAVRALLDRVGGATGDRDLARRRGWLSPACGLGLRTREGAAATRRALARASAAWT
jgi:hypothetical protein